MSRTVEPPEHAAETRALRVVRLALHVLFYVLLAIGLATGSGSALGWGLGAALAVTYAVGGLAGRRLPVPAGLWLALLCLLWILLVLAEPSTGYVAFPLYFLCLHLLRGRWSVPGVGLLTAAVVAAQAQTGGGLTAAKVIGPCAGALVALLTAYGYQALYRESGRRQRLIVDLIRTRDELAASQREAGRLAERQRLSREIHDTLAQGLSSIVLLARTASPADYPSRLREIEETAAANLAEARRFVADLRPVQLENASLPEALRRLAAGADVEFRLEGEPVPLPVEAEVALLRLAQEALANVRRHAKAERTAVTLAYQDDEVTLDVFDDGVGFDPQLVRPGEHFGLHGMRQRIGELGGGVSVESAPGEGTVVAASLPVAAREVS
jgi:signal transduction histidine kinase